jgi:hypothetical protein
VTGRDFIVGASGSLVPSVIQQHGGREINADLSVRLFWNHYPTIFADP